MIYGAFCMSFLHDFVIFVCDLICDFKEGIRKKISDLTLVLNSFHINKKGDFDFPLKFAGSSSTCSSIIQFIRIR